MRLCLVSLFSSHVLTLCVNHLVSLFTLTLILFIFIWGGADRPGTQKKHVTLTPASLGPAPSVTTQQDALGVARPVMSTMRPTRATGSGRPSALTEKTALMTRTRCRPRMVAASFAHWGGSSTTPPISPLQSGFAKLFDILHSHDLF